MKKVLFAFVVLLLSFLLINQNNIVAKQTLSISCWLVWGIDDVSTHYLTESSVDIIFYLKNFLFDKYKSIESFHEYIEPQKLRSYSPEEYSFKIMHDAIIEPLYFPGLLKETSAIKKWGNIEYLNNTIGDVICPVVLTNANHFEIQREAKSYKEILNIIHNDPKSSIYVSGDQFIFNSESGNKLLNDLELENKLGKEFMNSTLYSKDELYFFLGNKGMSGTSWHCAPNRSLFVQIFGRKRWTFIHPKYSLLLHPQRSHLYSRIFLAGDSFQYFNNQEEKNKGKNNTIQSDSEIFGHVPRMQVILEPGDAVTVPSWYWHHVENLPNNEEGEHNMIIGVDVDTKDWNHSYLHAFFPFSS